MKSFHDRRWLLTGLTILIAAALAVAATVAREALWPVAVYTGWLLLALVLALTFFNARKKLPFLPLFSASTWLQAHIYIGWLSCFVFLLHTGARIPSGRLETMLAIAFIAVAVSGAFGLWLSRWLPPRLVRSGESLIYERIPVLRHRLTEEAREVVRRAETETQSSTLPDFHLRVLHRYFQRVPPLLAPLTGDDPEFHRVRQELDSTRRYLNESEETLARTLADLVEAKRNLDVQLAGQRLLKLWLFVHIPLTYVLLVFIAAHVWLVLHFSHRF
jgi:hypothetical protein